MPSKPAASVPSGGRRGCAASGVGPWVVVGLGNPGPKYAGHRHNVGAMAVAQLAQEYGETLRAHRSRCLIAQVRVQPPAPTPKQRPPAKAPSGPADPRRGADDARGSQDPATPLTVVFAQPTTFMNEAGGPVRALMDYFSVNSQRLVVVHDDLEIDYGTIRVKPGGGAAGHNGLRSVTSALGTSEFTRVRIGIGRPPGRQDPASYVLHDFSRVEQRELPFVFTDARDAIEGCLFTDRSSGTNGGMD